MGVGRERPRLSIERNIMELNEINEILSSDTDAAIPVSCDLRYTTTSFILH